MSQATDARYPKTDEGRRARSARLDKAAAAARERAQRAQARADKAAARANDARAWLDPVFRRDHAAAVRAKRAAAVREHRRRARELAESSRVLAPAPLRADPFA